MYRNNFTHTLRIHRRECDEYLSDEDEFPDEDDVNLPNLRHSNFLSSNYRILIWQSTFQDIFDVLEKELEENDPVQFEVEELQGENLLAMCYISLNVVNQNLQPEYSTQDTRRESLTLVNNLLSRFVIITFQSVFFTTLSICFPRRCPYLCFSNNLCWKV